MVGAHFPLLSTINGGDHWCCAALTQADWKSAADVWHRRPESPAPLRVLSPIPAQTAGELNWEDRVRWVDDRPYPEVLLVPGTAYSIGVAYDKAQRTRDPYLSPHGMFRHLNHGDAYHAFQFLQEFGPLIWPGGPNLYASWIDLNDFWARHLRFVVVSELWEKRESADGLAQAWNSIRERLPEIDAGGVAPFGSLPDFPNNDFKIRPSFPWEIPAQDFAAIALELMSTEFVRREIVLHTKDCRLTWSKAQEEGRTVLRPDRFFVSLWGALWDLFGRDIWQKRSMLVCRVCGRLFYPKRADSTCCSSRHQSLWSKRLYAREKRAREKKQRLQGEVSAAGSKRINPKNER